MSQQQDEQVVEEPTIDMDALEAQAERIRQGEPAEELTLETKPAAQVEVEMSKEEEDARAQGWRPLEEYSGPEDEWVDAHTFIGRGTFIKQNKRLKDEIDQLKKTMETFKGHMTKSEKVMYEKAKKEIVAELQAAKQQGDFDRFEQAQQELHALEPTSPEAHNRQVLEEFVSRHEFLSDPQTDDDYELLGIAQAADIMYSKKHPNAPVEDVVKFVESKLKEKQEGKMKNVKREEPPATVSKKMSKASSSTVRRGNAKDPHPEYYKLTNEQKELAAQFTDPRFGIPGYTIEKYIDELKASDALKSD